MINKGKSTGHKDFLGNEICIEDILVFVPFIRQRTFTLITGTVIRNSRMKLWVRNIGNQEEGWVFPTATINIKNLKE